MRKVLLMVAMVGLVAGPAIADLVPGGEPVATLVATNMGSWDCPDCERVYENLDYVNLYDDIGGGEDDYQIADTPSCPDWPEGQFEMCAFSFVGGVNVANDQLRADFYEADGTWVTAYAITLPDAGLYIWRISFADPECPTGIFLPEDGQFQLRVHTATSFDWFSETDSAEIGTEDIKVLGPNDVESWTWAFDACVPEPATLSLLALGGLALLRRRH